MTEHLPNSGQQILVGVDGSGAADVAVRYAAELASTRSRSLQIVHALGLVDVSLAYANASGDVPGFDDVLRTGGQRIVTAAAQLAREVDPNLEITAEVSPHSPARVLVELSQHAHVVIIGGPDTGRFGASGSTAVSVSSHAHGPVVVVRTARGADTPPSTGPVVVGVDGSAVSDAAIGVAFDEASHRGAPLIALHAWSDTAFATGNYAGDRGLLTPATDYEVIERAVLAERLAGWQEKYPDVRVERRIYPDAPRDRLLELSDHAQLLVVGSRGRGGFRGLLLGSTSNTLVAHAHCPVFVVRPPRER